jgi:hypothetical protein
MASANAYFEGMCPSPETESLQDAARNLLKDNIKGVIANVASTGVSPIHVYVILILSDHSCTRPCSSMSWILSSTAPADS